MFDHPSLLLPATEQIQQRSKALNPKMLYGKWQQSLYIKQFPFKKRELAVVISAMFCGCPVRGEQNGFKICYYWGELFNCPSNSQIIPAVIFSGKSSGELGNGNPLGLAL